ncbi:MAG: methionyl-tRNA formyltransferase [Pseudomonadota bacterium]
MRLIFMGTPEFSVPALHALHAAGHEVACVYTQPPRPAGRGKKERQTAVQAAADALGLPVRHPVSLKSADAQAAFAALEAELAVVVAYGLILPQAILDAPARGCLNIHASLLPRWRGAAPIHRAVMAGDAETGVCIMQMEAGLDTGPVLMGEATAIGATETTADLHDRLAEMGGRLIVKTVASLDTLTAVAQPEAGVTYAHKIDKAEAAIDWAQPAAVVDRQIRGLSPFPGAWFQMDGARLKALGSEYVDMQGAPGMVLDDRLTVACGSGAVRLTRVQKAGKGAQDAAEFLRGTPVPAGTELGA